MFHGRGGGGGWKDGEVLPGLGRETSLTPRLEIPLIRGSETRSENLSNVAEINDEFTRRERVNLEARYISFLDEKSDM